MGLTDIFVKRPVLAAMLSLLILMVGVRCALELPLRQFPKLQNTVISVDTVYPGATPELMRSFITTPIEQAVSTAEGIDYITSTSFTSQSLVVAHIRLDFDGGRAMSEVLAKVQQVKYLIPAGALDPVITKTTGQVTPALFMGFDSSTMSGPAISDYLSRVVQPMLAAVPGVASTELIGGQVFAMRLWLDPHRMAARGISADQVAAAVRANNFQSAPGQTKGYYTLTNVSAATDAGSVEQFRDLVVKASGGSLVRMRDIANVELGPQSVRSEVSMNGRHAVFLSVNATPDGNPLQTVRLIRLRLETLKKALPPGLGMRVTYDSTLFIAAALHEVTRTLWQAGLSVGIVILLTLGSARSVLVPLVTIPLSMVGTMTLLYCCGFSINLLTLLALVMAVGLVVDDAIVVLENVHRRIRNGAGPSDAALLAAREMFGPVITMTLTLVVAYLPIGLLGGLTGVLFREFACTLTGAVLMSGVIALTLSPMMCAKLLPATKPGAAGGLVDRSFDALAGWYGRRLHHSLDYRPVTALVACSLVLLLGFEFFNSSTELAPAEDQGILFAMTKAPQAVNLDYTRAYSGTIDRVLRSFPETSADFVISGLSESTNQGMAGMILKPWQERRRTAQELTGPLMGSLFARVQGLQTFAFSPPPLPGDTDGLPVQMVISSPGDYQALYRVMDRIKQRAWRSGLFLVVDSDLAFNQPTMQLHVNQAKANELGVTMQAVGDTLAILVGENFINRFGTEGRSYYVVPQVPRTKRLGPSSFDHYYVASASGQQIPLSALVSVEMTIRPNALNRYDQLNSATLSAVPGTGVTMGQEVAFLEQAAHDLLPPDFQHDFLSQSRQYLREGSKLNLTIGFALLTVYLILAAQFESLRDPFVILVSVPLALCGAMLPLFLGVTTLNLYTQIGLITLVGLIAKHGILLIQFANQAQERGLDRRRAIEHAAQVRLRPILMTTAAMTIGLVPLLVASGAGAMARFSIGIVIVSGLLFGTFLTLFVLPMVYTVLARNRTGRAVPASAAPQDGSTATAPRPARDLEPVA